jgi:hypothetical protein
LAFGNVSTVIRCAKPNQVHSYFVDGLVELSTVTIIL